MMLLDSIAPFPPIMTFEMCLEAMFSLRETGDGIGGLGAEGEWKKTSRFQFYSNNYNVHFHTHELKHL